MVVMCYVDTFAGAVKLTDFGLAAQLTEKVQQRKTMLGTAEFMAPEILRGDSYGCKVRVCTALVLADVRLSANRLMCGRWECLCSRCWSAKRRLHRSTT